MCVQKHTVCFGNIVVQCGSLFRMCHSAPGVPTAQWHVPAIYLLASWAAGGSGVTMMSWLLH